MSVSFANCHFHSIFSDGDFTPEWLVERARSLGHRAVILTDHDTVRGCYFLQKAARRAGLLSLSGCEFTTKSPYGSPHLVGIDFNTENTRMRKLLARISPMQTERSHLMFEYGLKRGSLRGGITWQDVLDAFPDNDYLCNNQVFAVMVQRGIYKPEEYMPEFFKKNFSGKTPLEEELSAAIKDIYAWGIPDLEEVISTIRHAGGVPVIAHPHKAAAKADIYREMGVMGFETHHPDLDAEDEAFFTAYCDEHNIYKLGGTDHSGLMGCPSHYDVPSDSGGTEEEEFWMLYRREKG